MMKSAKKSQWLLETYENTGFLKLFYDGTVPDGEVGCCLGSEGNGISVGEGGMGRTGPPERGKDKQSMPNKGRDNMGKDEDNQPSRMR
jgi:hypothetical protein